MSTKPLGRPRSAAPKRNQFTTQMRPDLVLMIQLVSKHRGVTCAAYLDDACRERVVSDYTKMLAALTAEIPAKK